MQTTTEKKKLTFKLPADFPAPDYLRTQDSRYWPFQSVPYRNKWKMRHKIAYALQCRMSQNDAERLGWGRQFERTYWRVSCCIVYRFSDSWQERRAESPHLAGDRLYAWFESNKRKLGYV